MHIDRRSIRRSFAILVLALPLAVTGGIAATPVTAQVSDAAFKCQRATATALAKHAKSHSSCHTKCQQRARKAETSFSDCVLPYADAVMLSCLYGPGGNLGKAVAAIVKACGEPGACPSCYGDCTASGHPTTTVLTRETASGVVLDEVQCEPAATPATAKCMDATSKAHAKYVAAVSKCYEKCRANERKGITAGSCNAPATDPVTTACVGLAATKAALAIDKKCFIPPATPPSCPSWPASGAAWVGRFDYFLEFFLTEDSGQPFCVPPVCCQQGASCTAEPNATACTNAGGTPFESQVCEASGGCVPPPGTIGECCNLNPGCAADPVIANCGLAPGVTRVPAAVCVPGDDNVCVAAPRKLVFVSITATDGAFGGAAAADGLCQSEASAAALGGTFKAWVSDGMTNPATRFTQATVPYKRIDGVTVADDWTDLIDGTLDAPIDRDSLGTPTAAGVWTGTATTGATGAFHCSSWTTAMPLPLGTAGTTSSMGAQWTQQTFASCAELRRLYCFEQ